jgi:hypothetical protein
MKLLHSDLVQEYFESIREDYPNLTLEECNSICSAPFLEARRGIESGEFPTIRLKFFGTFITTPNRLKGMLKTYEKMFKEHRITPVKYFKKKEMLEKSLIKKQTNGSKNKLG